MKSFSHNLTDVPLLAGCSIRLSGRRDRELSKLAEQKIQMLTGSWPPRTTTSKPFRFLELPTELREHILAFTDLATPWHEMEWNPSGGMYWRDPYGWLVGEWRTPQDAHGSRGEHPGYDDPWAPCAFPRRGQSSVLWAEPLRDSPAFCQYLGSLSEPSSDISINFPDGKSTSPCFEVSPAHRDCVFAAARDELGLLLPQQS